MWHKFKIREQSKKRSGLPPSQAVIVTARQNTASMAPTTAYCKRDNFSLVFSLNTILIRNGIGIKISWNYMFISRHHSSRTYTKRSSEESSDKRF